MRFLTLLALSAVLLAPPLVSAQSMPQLTPEQQALLSRLPAAQREALLNQYAQLAGESTNQAGTREAGSDSNDRRSDPVGVDRPDLVDEPISIGDTILVEIQAPRIPETRIDGRQEAEAARRALAARTHLLIGMHTTKLDREGKLSLPGLMNIPLAGLSGKQAALRLRAEPLLRDMEVTVTRLPLTPTGRESLKPFGYEIFVGQDEETLRFNDGGLARETRRGLPVSASYVVGPGDQVVLQLFGKDSARVELEVTSEGVIQVPVLGPVAVAGMRFQEMKELVERRVQEQTIGVRAHLSMGELRSIEVFVFGDVQKPGAHSVGGTATVMHALYEAEGITTIGSLRDIRVLRGGDTVARIDLYDMLLEGRGDHGARLEAGDIVFVPSIGARIGVMGEVRRPAWYELDTDSTLADLLGYAGGATAQGDLHKVQIERITADGVPRILDVDLTTEAGRRATLRNGDLVVLNRLAQDARNTVALRGYFTQPGLREWRDGMRLNDLLASRAALGEDPDLDYGLVVRQLPDGHGIHIEMFAPRAVLDDPESLDNLVLQQRDEVLVFGFDDYRGRRALINPLIEKLKRQATRDRGAMVAQVSGSVRAPGDYPIASGMSLTDLLRAGGGVDESAYIETAEVTRYEIRGGTERQIEHITVDLDQALAGNPAANLAVAPHDVLTVKQLSLWTQQGVIELRGEVQFPGIYPIKPGEPLSAVINRAGGLTALAYPQAAVFTRETLRRKERDQIEQMIQRLESDAAAVGAQSDAASAQARAVSTSLASQLRDTDPVGRLVIDLRKVIDQPGDTDLDVLVKDGDRLVVPSRPQEVTVFGEVNFPTSHIYEPGLRYSEYIDRSGGMTYRADDGRTYVVRANGAVESLKRRSDIHPGDTIVVPVDAERLPAMVRVMNISQIVYQLAIAAAAWQSLGVL